MRDTRRGTSPVPSPSHMIGSKNQMVIGNQTSNMMNYGATAPPRYHGPNRRHNVQPMQSKMVHQNQQSNHNWGGTYYNFFSCYNCFRNFMDLVFWYF